MGDYLGWRAKFGVTTPSVNSVVQPEYDDMRPAGVTNHVARMHMADMQVHSDDDFSLLIRRIDEALDPAIDRVMAVAPDHLILGISALAVWGGNLQWGRDLTARMKARAGRDIPVSHAADAVPAALKAYGVTKGNIAIMEPYYPVIEGKMRGFFGELGYEVKRYKHFRGKVPVAYSHVTAKDMIDAVREIDGDDIDAIVQFGANMPMAKLCDEVERWLDKPVVGVNVCTYWHALRTHGIEDKVMGYTRLLREF